MECTKYFKRYRAAYTGAAGAVYRPLVLCQPPARAVQARRRLQDLITGAMATSSFHAYDTIDRCEMVQHAGMWCHP
jgi:hypothetical protein